MYNPLPINKNYSMRKTKSMNSQESRSNKTAIITPNIFDHWGRQIKLKADNQSLQKNKKPNIPKPLIKRHNSIEAKIKNKRKPEVQTQQSTICQVGSPPRRTVQKAQSAKYLPQKQQVSPSNIKQTFRQIIRIIEKEKVQFQKKTYEWRMNTHFPVIKVQLKSSKLIKMANHDEQSYEFILRVSSFQEIKYKLSQITQFSLLNSMYILNQALVSFERLYNRFGYFQPSLDLIFITQGLKCKVWLNQYIWQNQAADEVTRLVKIEDFYQRIIAIFIQFFSKSILNKSYGKKSMNLIQKLLIELQSRKDFVQALKYINQFLNIYSLKLNQKYIQYLPNTSLNTDFRYRIQSTMEKTMLTMQSARDRKTRVVTSPIIQNSKRIPNFMKKQIDNQENMNQVTQSNVKTITKANQCYNRNIEHTFKRQSQMSICSKQTLNDKKQRFSIQQSPNFPGFAHLNKSKVKLPEFTNQDYQDEQELNEDVQQSQSSVKYSNLKLFQLKRVQPDDQEQLKEQEHKLLRQQQVRQKNGWLSPFGLGEAQDCAKSFQDSQPSVKMMGIRDRNLSKLNRIKKSIANSIVDGSLI